MVDKIRCRLAATFAACLALFAACHPPAPLRVRDLVDPETTSVAGYRVHLLRMPAQGSLPLGVSIEADSIWAKANAVRPNDVVLTRHLDATELSSSKSFADTISSRLLERLKLGHSTSLRLIPTQAGVYGIRDSAAMEFAPRGECLWQSVQLATLMLRDSVEATPSAVLVSRMRTEFPDVKVLTVESDEIDHPYYEFDNLNASIGFVSKEFEPENVDTIKEIELDSSAQGDATRLFFYSITGIDFPAVLSDYESDRYKKRWRDERIAPKADFAELKFNCNFLDSNDPTRQKHWSLPPKVSSLGRNTIEAQKLQKGYVEYSYELKNVAWQALPYHRVRCKSGRLILYAQRFNPRD